MNIDEARLLIEAWNYFDSHPKERFWEGLPSISRDEFYRLMPIIIGIENLVEAKIYLERVAQGGISETVPGTIIEKAKEGEIPKPYIEDARRATASVRAWLKNIKPQTAEALAEREVAAAQVKAELARIEEVRAPAPIPEIPVPAVTPSPIENLGIGFKIISKGSLPTANRIIAAPLRSIISFAMPTAHAESTTQAAALSFVSIYGVSAKSLEPLKPKALSLGISPEQFDKFIQSVSKYEVALPQLIYQGRKLDISPYQVEALFFQPGGDGVSATLPRGGFFSNILRSAGQQFFGKASLKIIKGLASRAATKLGIKAAAAVAGAPGGPPGIIVGFLASFIPDALSWLKRNGSKVLIGLGTFLFGTGFVLHSPILMGTGGAIGASGLIGQEGGFGPALSRAGGVASSVIGGITSLTVASIATPLIVALISVPVLVALILFIINSGAYLVPPKAPVFTGILESPYIAVEKKASPDCLNRIDPAGKPCPPLPGEVTYEIEIKAKKGTLTNIKIENSYQVFGKGTGTITPPPIPTPQTISPTQPFKFSYKLKFEKNLNDSVVYDTLTVTADAPEQKGAEASDVASVIIGNPPASSCPILGGTISTGSYNGTREVGHGSNPYWNGPAGDDCGYDIPAFTGCYSPTSSTDPDGDNTCQGKPRACSYYGFAADVRRGGAGDIVQLPSIFGKSINWTFQNRVTIAETAWGWGYSFTGSDGKNNYSLYLGHLNQTTPPQTAPSGTIVGTLYPGVTPTHVHIELQINGQWVRPDFLCGGVGP